MLFQSHDIIELKRGGASLLIAPQYGGRILRWSVDGHEVIRWPADADWSNPPKIRGGDPLLFPFLGRHFVDGRLGFWRDRAGQVYPLPTHGFARDCAFAVGPDAFGASGGDDGGAREVRVTLVDNAQTRAGYPFAFAFEARYRLLDGALDIELTTHNRDTVPLPYYAGHHFYFALPRGLRGETTLTMPTHRGLNQEADGRLGPALAETGRYRLDDPRLVDRFHLLDADAAAAAGIERARPDGNAPGPVTARLQTPSLRRTIDFHLAFPGSVPWYAVTTWTESADADFYCVEPWLGLPDAIHHGQGLRWIAPGASERAIVRLTVRHESHSAGTP